MRGGAPPWMKTGGSAMLRPAPAVWTETGCLWCPAARSWVWSRGSHGITDCRPRRARGARTTGSHARRILPTDLATVHTT